MNIDQYAIEKGYDKALKTDLVFNGFDVYELTFDEDCFVGLPQFLLLKGESMRVGELEENVKIFDLLYKEE